MMRAKRKNEMRIPDNKKCLALLKKYTVPEHIIAHSILVAKIADFLAEKLEREGVKVNKNLVNAAALLHDIDKMATLNNGNHSIKGCEILKEEGYGEVGKVVLAHIIRKNMDIYPRTWEDKIVFYADKLVVHDTIASLEERFDDLMKRYSKHRKNIILTRTFAEKIEKEIFDKIKIEPDSIRQYISINTKISA